MKIPTTHVHDLGTITNLVLNQTTIAIDDGTMAGWFRLCKGNSKESEYPTIVTSARSMSVTKPTHYLEYSKLNTIQRAYMQYKLDGYVNAAGNLNRGVIYNCGHVAVASEVSTPEIAIRTGTMVYVGKVEGNNYYHYIIPALGPDNVKLGYDSYPVMCYNNKYISLMEFANMQQYFDKETIDFVVRVVNVMHDNYKGDK